MSQVSFLPLAERRKWRSKLNAALMKRGLQSRSGVCSCCGCTDHDCRDCIRRTGKPCHWINVERTLCSACV